MNLNTYVPTVKVGQSDTTWKGLILVSWGANTPHHILPYEGNKYTLNIYTKTQVIA